MRYQRLLLVAVAATLIEGLRLLLFVTNRRPGRAAGYSIRQLSGITGFQSLTACFFALVRRIDC